MYRLAYDRYITVDMQMFFETVKNIFKIKNNSYSIFYQKVSFLLLKLFNFLILSNSIIEYNEIIRKFNL